MILSGAGARYPDPLTLGSSPIRDTEALAAREARRLVGPRSGPAPPGDLVSDESRSGPRGSTEDWAVHHFPISGCRGRRRSGDSTAGRFAAGVLTAPGRSLCVAKWHPVALSGKFSDLFGSLRPQNRSRRPGRTTARGPASGPMTRAPSPQRRMDPGDSGEDVPTLWMAESPVRTRWPAPCSDRMRSKFPPMTAAEPRRVRAGRPRRRGGRPRPFRAGPTRLGISSWADPCQGGGAAQVVPAANSRLRRGAAGLDPLRPTDTACKSLYIQDAAVSQFFKRDALILWVRLVATTSAARRKNLS
jgi:hypothetical protein